MTFHEEFDLLQKEHNIEKTKDFLLSYLEKSLNEHNTEGIITCLNETIGFFRDIEDFKSSSKYAHTLANLLNKISINPDALFISFINIANALRANLELEEAKKYFLAGIDVYNNYNLKNESDLAALYNNWALLYQNIDLNTSIEYFLKALDILKRNDNRLRIGITYINIGYSYLGLNDILKTKEYINYANLIFDDLKDDFHYSSLLCLNAKYYNLINDYESSYTYYREALSHIDKFQGRAKTYFETFKEYKYVCEKLKRDSFRKLLIINKEFFNETFKNFPKELLNDVVVGSFGYGSDKLGLDDLNSIDHDYEPGYIILYKDELSIEKVNKIKEFYNELPEFYDIYYRRNNKYNGVFSLNNFLESIGITDIDNISNESLALLTNGMIFYNGFIDFKQLRENALLRYKLNIKMDISLNILKINQLNYNICREHKRKNYLVVKYLKNNLVEELINLYYLDNKLVLVHDKQRLKLIKHTSKVYKFINAVLNNNYSKIVNDLNNYLLKLLKKYKLIKRIDSNYIEDYKNEILYNKEMYQNKLDLALKICDIEFSMHQKLNAYGGVQECQYNKSYYYIMRLSQHLNLSLEFLKSYYNDLVEAQNNNISIPFIKYAFMEKTTDIDMYNNVKDLLPVISPKRQELQEAIISLQLEMMEKYSKKNSDVNNMRTLYTSTDNKNNASYETYLRAELSSYSEASVLEYAKNLTLFSKRKINFVKEVVDLSKYLYK